MDSVTLTTERDEARDEADERLTPTQRAIRDSNATLPRHVRRSIDRYRVALGMVPLWGDSLERRRRS